jgi:CHAD domain-containing protein
VPYHIKRSESIAEAVKRMGCEELDFAARQLSRPSRGSDGIHEARKSVKKVRALLRLVREPLGDRYRQENRDLRDIGRRLSPLRDSVALIETFDELRKNHAEGLSKPILDGVRKGLVAEKKHLEQEAKSHRVAAETAKLLRTAVGRVESWPLKGSGFEVLRDGVERVFQAARKSMKRAERSPNAANYHEWRKRVKDHWYLMRVLENIWPEMMTAERDTLHTLEEFLGEDHNLVVMREKIGNRKGLKPLRNGIQEYQKQLREAAMALGKRVYDEKPAEFLERTEHLWDLWQAQPGEVKELLN